MMVMIAEEEEAQEQSSSSSQNYSHASQKKYGSYVLIPSTYSRRMRYPTKA